MKELLRKFRRGFKRFVCLCGYGRVKFGRAPTRHTMEESLRHLSQLGYRPSIVVDVGTANGTDALLEVFPNSRYLWIEPLREFEADLKRLTARYRGEYLIAACGKNAGLVTINVHPQLTGSSIMHESDGTDADGVPREVQMYRLDDLIAKYDLTGDVLLKADVQGAELEVLEGATDLLNSCEVIVLEVAFFRFLKTNPEFYDVIHYMKQKGFVVYDIFGGTNRLLDGALAQKDVLFVKEDGLYRKSHRWATPEQRSSHVARSRKRNP